MGCYRPDLPTFSITPTLFAPGVRGSIVGRGAFCFGRLGLLGPGSPQVASVTLIGTGEQLGSPASFILQFQLGESFLEGVWTGPGEEVGRDVV